MTAVEAPFATGRLGDAVLSLELPAAPESLAVVRQALTGVASALGMADPVLEDVKVAVTEAATNAVLHAYPDAAGPVLVEVWHAGSELVVRVGDEGEGMRPRLSRVSPGLGLGLRMIATLSTQMSIATDGRGTRVWMSFSLDDRPGS